jgi:hypothetical protein
MLQARTGYSVMLGCILAAAFALLLGGFAAKLSIARRTPSEQRAKASRTRGLKIPACEAEFFCIRFFCFPVSSTSVLGPQLALLVGKK